MCHCSLTKASFTHAILEQVVRKIRYARNPHERSCLDVHIFRNAFTKSEMQNQIVRDLSLLALRGCAFR